MSQSIPEILQTINNAVDTVDALRFYLKTQPLKYIFGFNFIPKCKFLLPEGEPPYKPHVAPLGTAPTTLMYEAKLLNKFCNPDAKSARLETLFVQLLENLHHTDAKVLLLLKDQILESVYPNITLEKVVYSGYFVQPHFTEGWVNPMDKWKAEQQKIADMKASVETVLEPVKPTIKKEKTNA